jgi:phosphoserine phosphatase
MRMIVYSPPGLDDTGLVSSVRNAVCVPRADWSDGICKEGLDARMRSFNEQVSSMGSNIIVYAHLPPVGSGEAETFFRQYDRGLYDVFVYLDVDDDVVDDRRDSEILLLHSECLRLGKEFIIINRGYGLETEFLEGILDGSILTAPAAAREAADRIIGSSKGRRVVLSDGDDTLMDIDLTMSILEQSAPTRDPFSRRRYTTYQYWLAYRTNEVPDIESAFERAVSNSSFVEPLMEDVSAIDALRVVVTGGIDDLWRRALDGREGFGTVAGSRADGTACMSQFAKVLLARYVRQAGIEVIALGDSMVDYYMLLEADRGFVIAHRKKNPSLQE